MSLLSDTELQDALMLMVEMAVEAGTDDASNIDRVTSYADACVLTSDAGFVVRLRDGAEFQVTIVRSK